MTEAENTARTGREPDLVPPARFKPWVVIFVNLQAIAFGIAIVWLAWHVGRPGNGDTIGGTHFAYLNLLIAILGSCVGWLVG
ncbi:MAG TPA: hypothetical protein VMZ26_04655, partial [Pyrinomonadaceae bacterium]|nr:hypothetical protein [Pyrinomonadaceae bacterium]